MAKISGEKFWSFDIRHRHVGGLIFAGYVEWRVRITTVPFKPLNDQGCLHGIDGHRTYSYEST